jgi:hypothetical protein
MVLALIVTLVFAVTAGMFVSSISRSEKRAVNGTVLLTGFFVVLVPLLQRVVDMPFSPTCAFLGWDDKSYSSQSTTYWTAVWSTLLISAMFIVLASLILPRAWQERPDTAQNAAWLSGGRRWTSRQKAARRRLLNVNPVIWLATRAEQQTFLVWTLILSGSTVGLALWFIAGGIKMATFSILLLFLLMHLMLSMWVASEACAVFPAARDSGALELLLSTPLTMREIVDGHVIGMTRLFRGPLFALLVAEGILLVAYLTMGARQGIQARELGFALFAVGLFLTTSITDLFAVARYGMWVGLIEKRAGWAVTRTILLVLLVPVIVALPFGCLWPLWPVVGVLKNLYFISRGQELLRRNFRTAVTERFGTAAAADPIQAKRLKRASESALPPVLPR